MKKNIACPYCKGKGYNTVMTGIRGDYCGVMNETCPKCNGTGVELADMTNADFIRVMSDKELAEFIGHNSLCDRVQGDGSWCENHAVCENCLIDWLQQPVGEVSNGH